MKSILPEHKWPRDREWPPVVPWPLVLGVVVGVMSMAGSARASDPLPGLMPKGALPDTLKTLTARTRVGSWVEYSVQHKLKRMKYRWRIALVGKAKGNRFWWEYYIRWGRLRSLVIKILVRGTKHDPRSLERIIWKAGGHQAMEVPVRKGQKLVDFYALRPAQKGRIVGKRQITVVAGRFNAMYIVSKNRAGQDVHFYTSSVVPIMGLLKLLSPELRMELTGFGHRARSMIRGKPAKWLLKR